MLAADHTKPEAGNFDHELGALQPVFEFDEVFDGYSHIAKPFLTLTMVARGEEVF